MSLQLIFKKLKNKRSAHKSIDVNNKSDVIWCTFENVCLIYFPIKYKTVRSAAFKVNNNMYITHKICDQSTQNLSSRRIKVTSLSESQLAIIRPNYTNIKRCVLQLYFKPNLDKD